MDDHENKSCSTNVNRFHKRLAKYRTHSNDCKIRVDQNSDQLHEQQNNDISLLQTKTTEQQKKKRTNKKGLMRQAEHLVYNNIFCDKKFLVKHVLYFRIQL